MIATLIVLQSLALLFIIATFGAINRIVLILTKTLAEHSVSLSPISPLTRRNPWPDREN